MGSHSDLQLLGVPFTSETHRPSGPEDLTYHCVQPSIPLPDEDIEAHSGKGLAQGLSQLVAEPGLGRYPIQSLCGKGAGEPAPGMRAHARTLRRAGAQVRRARGQV